LREFREVLPPTIFFFIGFNLIVLTTHLILADYGVQFASFMIATASALVVAKAVLVANAMLGDHVWAGAARSEIAGSRTVRC